MGFIQKIKNMFKRGQSKAATSNGTANINKGFHPEILFLINRPYAEYIDYEEV